MATKDEITPNGGLVIRISPKNAMSSGLGNIVIGQKNDI